jgi:hemolysin D
MRDFIDIRTGDPQQRNGEADEEERMKRLLRHLAVWRAAWQIEQTMPSAVVSGGSAVEFLPAVLEIQHAPPSPIGRAILWTIMLVFTTAVTWSSLSHIDIVAVAPGQDLFPVVIPKPSSHSKPVSLLPFTYKTVKPFVRERC